MGGEAEQIRAALGGAVEYEWPEPEKVSASLLPVPPFNLQLVPQPFRPWVGDIAERSQCPPDFLGVGALVACSALVARRLAIRPKRHDDWVVVPNLWGAVVSPPGFLKSPALAETLRPLNRLAVEAAGRFKEDTKAHDLEGSVRKARRDNLEGQMRAAARRKDNGSMEMLRLELGALDSEPPYESRFLVNDTTVEKLGELLNQNPGGLLVFRDELSGFLRSLERQGHETDRAFYCEAWNGSGRFTYDRIGRGTLHIENARVSLLGGIQPGVWRAYLAESFADGRDDGFVSRIQALVYPDVGGKWVNVDRWPNMEAKECAWRVFSALNQLEPTALEAKQSDGTEIPFLRFDDEAQQCFNEWRADLEAKLRDENEHPVIVSHLAKYRKLMPALALVFHVIDCVGGFGSFGRGVPRRSALMAAAWCDYLEPHARRCYQSVTDKTNAAAGNLAAKISGGKLTNPFTARDVYRAGWAGLREPEVVNGATSVLEDANWLHRVEVPADPAHGGRPTSKFYINPKVPKETPSKAPEEEALQ